MTSIKVADPHIDEYPKIETLYDRDPATFKVIEGAYRCPEFTAINRWLVTEKVDGTNVRVAITASGNVYFRGRTDNAQFHPPLLAYLQTTFTPEKMATLWKDDARPPIVLYGEGYGPKIQKGGGNYRADPSFRLFDVRVGEWWLEWPNVVDVARTLSIRTVPVLGVMSLSDALLNVRNASNTAKEDGGHGCQQEGIVARSDPLMLTRCGDRIVWKLKARDF